MVKDKRTSTTEYFHNVGILSSMLLFIKLY